ncbi:MAG TPA: CDGSH iron-sulfur domain-containing protein [Nitrososphaeraceae archaeon]|nr:CDGSH iron-sulfur domain-containing protein [Nitrososphaeraceae archaeon]
MQPTIVENLVNSEGKQFSKIGIALCRCGESWNKSFCDCTPATISLSENKSNENDIIRQNNLIKDKKNNYCLQEYYISDLSSD